MSKQDDQAVAQPEVPKLSSWHPAIVTWDMAQMGAQGPMKISQRLKRL